ncbi:hypothetical protein BY996DRAFT_8683517 [Phakopsora pachyrhizi]|nr:hypothetical protein BY996DRAFT_8683517 [Phakopsora pachyrhizi]
MDPNHSRQITHGRTIDNIMLKCLLCNTRATTNLVKKSNTEHHKAAVREIERRKNLHEQTINSLKAGLTKNLQLETDDSDGEDQISTDVNYFSNPNESDSDSDAESINSSELSSEFQNSLSERSEEMESSTDTIFETNIDDEVLGDYEDWYPFTKKEIMIGCLISGCTCSLISRKTYEHIQLVLRLCNVNLPSWKTVQSAKAKLQKKSNCKEHISELGNPLVSSCLEFYPEQSAGKNIYKLSQSKKWLQEYPRGLRAQIISVGGKHYYIYEPVQINDGSVVFPMFFYIKGGKMHAKACKLNFSVISSAEVNIFISWNRDFYSDDIKEIVGVDFLRPYAEILVSDRILLASKCRNILHEYTPEGKEIIQLPNPWRIKAEGKMIRNVPLSFYADDTTGLPPKLSNQEFDKLFVATSNIASALELAAPVFEELKKLTKTGFKAFDYTLQVDVLVLPVVLLFMADSPMHAEITSTMQPNASLMPCFDGHKDTPVEVLHVVLLGILKYLYQDLIGSLSANLTKYMADLDYFAQDFLLKLISTNAQWVNKPKFHMLIHLSQSIARFGPISLFATEKYESYNGVPPQSSAVYDESVPFGIKTKSPNSNWIKITSFYLNEKQIIKGNSFIILKAQPTNKNFIAYIIGIWGVDDFFNQKIYIHCIPCEIPGMDPFYGMCTLKKLNKEEFISAKSVISGVNVQHHYEGAKCLISRTLPMRLERQETDIMLKEIHHHFNFNLYVIKTASLRSQEYHHASARIPTPQIQPLDALNAVHDVLSEWKKKQEQ